MRTTSIRLRLLAAGGAAVLVSLALAAAGLMLIFERHVQRLAVVELAADLDQLAAGLERGPDGTLVMAQPPTDPRYDQPLSGLYWQVQTATDTLVSRSLWDETITLPEAAPGGSPREHLVPGPRGATLLLLERRLRLGPDGARIATALDRAQLRNASRAFAGDLVPYIGLLAAALIAAGWAQVAIGLRPLAAVGARVAAVRSGVARTLGTDFPAEVQPLAAEVDALITAREADITRARARAADLAHGLKTPLQALMGEADRLRDRGLTAESTGIEEVATAMRRHVDRELARARIASRSRAVATDPAPVVARLVAVLRRTRDGARVSWDVAAMPGTALRIDPDDLTEALGALLENAARHARTRVRVGLVAAGDTTAVTITDDGPGIPPSRLADLTARGARLDLAGPDAGIGTGLGLAIAGDIAEAAGGRLVLANDAAGGLTVALHLPIAPLTAS